jgi:hypothetical protein
MYLPLILAFLCALLFPAVGVGQPLGAGGGSFTYTGYGPLRAKPVQVYYHIPEGDLSQMPVLFALHGDERDGKAYATDWVAAAEKYKFMVFAPEFSEAFYGGGDRYALANMFADGDNPLPATVRPDSLWTFSILDPLFGYVKQRTGTQVAGYVAFGHSAGAQLLHRFVEYRPNSLMLKAICANAGWYTVPSASVAFPYGTGGSPFNDSLARVALSGNLLVLLGQLDVNQNSAGLRHTPQADEQGLNRLARGRYFYTNARAEATRLSTSFNWLLAEVAGVGHNHTLMAINAVPHALSGFTSPFNTPAIPINAYFTPQGIQLTGLTMKEGYSVEIYTLVGQKVFVTSGTYPTNQLVPFLPDRPAVYLLRLTTTAHGIITLRIAPLL